MDLFRGTTAEGCYLYKYYRLALLDSNSFIKARFGPYLVAGGIWMN